MKLLSSFKLYIYESHGVYFGKIENNTPYKPRTDIKLIPIIMNYIIH